MKRFLTATAAGILLMTACNETPDLTAFTGMDGVRIEVSGYTHFTYDPFTCQMAFNREKGEFRVYSDSMSDFFIVRLSEIPTETGQEVISDVIWTTNTDLVSRNGITLRLVQSQGDRLWLWNADYKIGVEVRVLE